ncbi:hypothetical protein N657DRAFT_635829 [Parathielavia appendiculata]|uniref:Uncharacterized protein n=1 Tax=Parathielavia appendiculata TaxID=2587402 RepID=A0AAN6Z0P7_9PEZI|nr:hypothetical protein N657DRAFT_635829 [Parathielavia appendiculata]
MAQFKTRERTGAASASICTCADTPLPLPDHRRAPAFATLCRTSRELNSLATAHLYHSPICDRNVAGLTQTLLTRKDLASLVEELRVPRVLAFGPSNWAPATAAHFTRRFQTVLDAESEIVVSAGNFPLDILTSLCLSLETLDATLDFRESFRLCTPHSLPRLHTVNLGHDDVDGGMDLSNIFSLIIAACPNFETLKYERRGPTGWFSQFSLLELRDAVIAHTPIFATLRVWYIRDLTSTWDDDWEDRSDIESVSELRSAMTARGIQFDYRGSSYSSPT